MSLLRPAADAQPVRWLVERLATFSNDVLLVVPSGFEAHARLLRPASKVACTSGGTSTPKPLCWLEVAALTERTVHRVMQWPSIQGTNPILKDYTALEAGDVYVAGPKEGSLPVEVARALWPILERHTNTRDNCLFAIWEGFGCLPRSVLEAPAFEIPARKFHLYTRPLEADEETFCTADSDEAVRMGTFVA